MIIIDCTVLDKDIDEIAKGYVDGPRKVERILTDLMECSIIDDHWGKHIYTEDGDYFPDNDNDIQKQVEQYITARLTNK